MKRKATGNGRQGKYARLRVYRRAQGRPTYASAYSGYRRVAVANGEMKFHDLDIDDAVVAVNGTIAQVSCLTIPEGNGESARVGRRITVRSILWRYNIQLPTTATAADTSDIVRVILYHDKQTNGATATITGILEANDFQAFNNLANKGRFTILMDRFHAVQATAGSGRGSTDTLSYGETNAQFSFFKKCAIPIEYDNSLTTGAVTTMRSSNIGVLLLSQGGHTFFGSKMRIRYSDN